MINTWDAHLEHGDALDFYDGWAKPTVIVSDGAYGIDWFDGELEGRESIADWYEPHVAKWSELCATYTTLWFFNTELGWANVHPVLRRHGWKYVRSCVWDKGVSHVVERANAKAPNQFPCRTEVVVQYVRDRIGGIQIRNPLRNEWIRTGLPFQKANEACGVKNAATRKYLASDSCFYIPPESQYAKLRGYANEYGNPEGKPYFNDDVIQESNAQLDGIRKKVQERQPKFRCPSDMTNVLSFPEPYGDERVRDLNGKAVHPQQKPLELMGLLIESTSDEGDVVWEPFGGLFTASLSAVMNKRIAYGAEIDETYYKEGSMRFCMMNSEPVQLRLF